MKKLLTFLLALMMISALSFGADRVWVKASAGTQLIGGSWADPTAWSGGVVPVDGDNVIFRNADNAPTNFTFTVTDVPSITLNDFTFERTSFPGPPEYLAGWIDLTLNGISDGVVITINNVFIGANYDVHVETGCKLKCNSSGARVQWDLKPGTHFQLRSSATFEEANFTGSADCKRTPVTNYGIKLESNADLHAEFVQSDANQNQIIGWQEFTLSPDYHQIGAPVSTDLGNTIGGTLATDPLRRDCRKSNCLCVLEGDYIKKYNIVTEGWSNFMGTINCYDASLDIEVGRGYLVWPLVENAWWYGKFNNGSTLSGFVSLPINQNTATSPNDGWSLVSNPFPSGLEFGIQAGQGGIPQVGAGWSWDLDQVENYAYYWDPNFGVTGSYRSWDWLHQVGSDAGVTNKFPRGQGFFVHNKIGASGGLYIGVNNLARAFVNKNIYKESRPNIIRLSLNNSSNEFIDIVSVYFLEGANYEYNSYSDPLKLFSQNEKTEVYIKTTDNVDVQVKTLPAVSGNTMVPVSMNVKSDGNYSLNASEISSFAPNTGIILKDLKTNTSVDLRTNPSYSFSANIGDDPVRFGLYFTDVLYGINPLNDNTFKVYSNDNSIYIQNNDLKNTSGTVLVYDMIGKQILQENLNSGAITKINTNLNKGFYIVSVKTNNGAFNQKVYIN